MNLIGQTIRHKTFGPGVVTNLAEGIVTVSFENTEKRFIYPDAFRRFLVFKDEEAQRHISKQIRQLDAEAQKVREAAQAEADRKQKLLNFRIVTNSHAVFDIPSDRIDRAIDNGQVSAGTYLSGYSKGMPRIAERLKPNSVCLLTTRTDGKTERERYVVGAFMAAEDFFGAEARDGIIKGHIHHRMRIPQESQVLFWEYFEQDAPPRWGNTAFRYCSGEVVNKILSDLTERLEKSGQKEAAISFYDYFCKINRLNSLIKPENE